MRAVGIIPARYGSARLPGKPLLEINGKPMVQHVYERAKKAKNLEEIWVATDSRKILQFCEKQQIPAVLTQNTHRCAAHRLQEASRQIQADFYVQINGDEPLISWENITAAVPKSLPREPEFGTNIVMSVTSPAEVLDPSNIKVVFDRGKKALYMSRIPIPYPYGSLDCTYYKHVGIIGYSKDMLDFYKNSDPGPLELAEGIDTLRFLDYGKPLYLIPVEKGESLSVDTPKDLEEVRKRSKNRELS
ncbi:MAG TPA: 3-deoxy-manno-octulosonate cytidylyltransferase [Candidatus Blautia merdipullorum]|nr:3-deoxy-manno-octulosonate cytidylyltransferase [Candidatus Blautia merdipullorum]